MFENLLNETLFLKDFEEIHFTYTRSYDEKENDLYKLFQSTFPSYIGEKNEILSEKFFSTFSILIGEENDKARAKTLHNNLMRILYIFLQYNFLSINFFNNMKNLNNFLNYLINNNEENTLNYFVKYFSNIFYLYKKQLNSSNTSSNSSSSSIITNITTEEDKTLNTEVISSAPSSYNSDLLKTTTIQFNEENYNILLNFLFKLVLNQLNLRLAQDATNLLVTIFLIEYTNNYTYYFNYFYKILLSLNNDNNQNSQMEIEGENSSTELVNSNQYFAEDSSTIISLLTLNILTNETNTILKLRLFDLSLNILNNITKKSSFISSNKYDINLIVKNYLNQNIIFENIKLILFYSDDVLEKLNILVLLRSFQHSMHFNFFTFLFSSGIFEWLINLIVIPDYVDKLFIGDDYEDNIGPSPDDLLIKKLHQLHTSAGLLKLNPDVLVNDSTILDVDVIETLIYLFKQYNKFNSLSSSSDQPSELNLLNNFHFYNINFLLIKLYNNLSSKNEIILVNTLNLLTEFSLISLTHLKIVFSFKLEKLLKKWISLMHHPKPELAGSAIKSIEMIFSNNYDDNLEDSSSDSIENNNLIDNAFSKSTSLQLKKKIFIYIGEVNETSNITTLAFILKQNRSPFLPLKHASLSLTASLVKQPNGWGILGKINPHNFLSLILI